MEFAALQEPEEQPYPILPGSVPPPPEELNPDLAPRPRRQPRGSDHEEELQPDEEVSSGELEEMRERDDQELTDEGSADSQDSDPNPAKPCPIEPRTVSSQTAQSEKPRGLGTSSFRAGQKFEEKSRS